MKLTSEKIVTNLLQKKSILKQKDDYTNIAVPKYDLSEYLSNTSYEPSRFGDKYLFVK